MYGPVSCPAPPAGSSHGSMSCKSANRNSLMCSTDLASTTAAISTRNLACGFWRSADRFDDRPALDFGQCVVTYAQLRELACSLAATLDRHQLPEGPRLVAILAGRSTTAFGGVLATLLSGGGYVPL